MAGDVLTPLRFACRDDASGTHDLDPALDHRALQEPGYRTILRLLLDDGYHPDPRQPFIFRRDVQLGKRTIAVEVDLLADEYGGTGRGHRTQSVQDLRARKARGSDLAFDLNAQVRVSGRLPEGGDDVVTVRVASIVPFLVMKGMVLAARIKSKDAYDVHLCVSRYPGCNVRSSDEFRPHLAHRLVQEGLQHIADQFASPAALGPKSLVDFEEVRDQNERELRQRDAYERITEWLRQLGFGGSDSTPGPHTSMWVAKVPRCEHPSTVPQQPTGSGLAQEAGAIAETRYSTPQRGLQRHNRGSGGCERR